MRPLQVLPVFAILGLLQAQPPSPAPPQPSCSGFQQTLRATYGFSPSKLGKAERVEKASQMDAVWNQVKARPELIPCLEHAIDAERKDSWFVFDGGQLLESITPSPQSRDRLLRGLAEVQLDDVDLRSWVRLAAKLGVAGLDTSELGRRWLAYPKARYFVTEHYYEVTRDNGALFILGSLDERFATPTLIALSRSGSGETREIAVSLLMSQATPEALKALVAVDGKGLSRSVAASLKALQTRPILIAPRESPKTSREQFRQAFEALLNGDDGPFEHLVSSVPDGERDLVAVFGPADLPQLRAVRRHYAARGNQHAIDYYNQFSQILMTLVWRP